MITDIILRIIDLLSQYSNVLIRRITMITDIILRIIDSWSQCFTFQHPRKLPEAMRKFTGSNLCQHHYEKPC